MNRIRCMSCRWYFADEGIEIAGQVLRHRCAARAYYPQPEDTEERIIPSAFSNGVVVYGDTHLARFWKGKLLCVGRLEWATTYVLPLLLSIAALAVSITALCLE